MFSRILKTSVTTFLNSDEENLQRNMEECAKMVCHGQHTYVYAQVRKSTVQAVQAVQAGRYRFIMDTMEISYCGNVPGI